MLNVTHSTQVSQFCFSFKSDKREKTEIVETDGTHNIWGLLYPLALYLTTYHNLLS